MFLSFTLSWQAIDASQWYMVQFSLSIFFWLADETASIFQLIVFDTDRTSNAKPENSATIC